MSDEPPGNWKERMASVLSPTAARSLCSLLITHYSSLISPSPPERHGLREVSQFSPETHADPAAVNVVVPALDLVEKAMISPRHRQEHRAARSRQQRQQWPSGVVIVSGTLRLEVHHLCETGRAQAVCQGSDIAEVL